MDSFPELGDRPNRLPIAIHILVVLALASSFISGVVVWRSQWVGQPARAWLVFHGSLNPLLAALFGYLLCDHIRLGWQHRRNRGSGFVMELVFAVLIVTGAGIYYGPESWQKNLVLTHRFCGTAIPAVLAWHWVAGHRLAKSSRLSK